MPLQSIKLLPGVNAEQTETLNETSWSSCNLIRFWDGMLQKLGGWVKYYPAQIGSAIRALLAWEGISNDLHLGVGAENSLSVITDGGNTDITPQTTTTNPTPNFITNSGSPIVEVNDSGITASTYEVVVFDTPVSVGGIVLNGVNSITQTTGTHSYDITASVNAAFTNRQSGITITIGSPTVINWTSHGLLKGSAVQFSTTGSLPAGMVANTVYYVIAAGLGANAFEISAAVNGAALNTSGSQSGTQSGAARGQVPIFTTTNGASSVSVTFPYHGYSVGSTANFISPTTIAGVTIQGLYTVTAVDDTSTFTINTVDLANATTTGGMNGGNIQLLYYIQQGPTLIGTGWGLGGWGLGGWGTGLPPPPISGTPITATDWTMDNWGEVLIACPAGGPIFTWAPATGVQNAGIIATAPTINDGIFIAMPQRILVAWGSSVLGVQDPLLIAWSDVANYNVWVASSVNQAGTFRLSSGSKVMGGFQAPGQALLWTDLDLWVMQYLGAPLVWGFNKIASGCGLVGRHAMGTLGGVVYWMSQNQFFLLAGNSVQPLPCSVWDVIFQDLDTAHLDKIRCAPNSFFHEISWYFPSLSGGTGEVDSYVKYNSVLQVWDYGSLSRSAWIDQSVLGSPIGATPTGYIYQHEMGNDDDGNPMDSWAQSGTAMIAEGNDFTFIDWFLPDFKYGMRNQAQAATMNITLSAVNYPNDTPNVFGPFTVSRASQYFDPRLRNRQVSIRIENNEVGTFYRIGNCRYRGAPDGRR